MILRMRLSVLLVVAILTASLPDARAQKFGLALKLDHFLIYRVEPVETKASVSLKGQFDRESIPGALPAIEYFAKPVMKDRGKLINPMAHLTWYKLAQRLKEPKRAVEFENQFGTQEILIDSPVALLVPTEKVEKGSRFPEGLDHYKLYPVLEARPFKRKVSLKDQFGSQEATATRTIFFGVPVSKSHEGKTYKISNEKAHLVIYETVPPKPYGKKQDTVDQFGKHSLTIIESKMLALPTVKIAWKSIGE